MLCHQFSHLRLEPVFGTETTRTGYWNPLTGEILEQRSKPSTCTTEYTFSVVRKVNVSGPEESVRVCG